MLMVINKIEIKKQVMGAYPEGLPKYTYVGIFSEMAFKRDTL